MALTKTEVSQLYVTIFNRASEGEGSEFWQTYNKLTPETETSADVANAMLETQDALDYFGNSIDSNQQFIEHIYLNTLNKTYADDPDGIDFWVSKLDGGESRGQVVVELAAAATDPANAGAAQDQFNNRVEVSDYTADTLEKAPYDMAELRFDGDLIVTDDPATVDSAKESVDELALITLTTPEVSQLYVAIFNRASEESGSEYWQTYNKATPEKETSADIANAMLETQDAKDYFGDSIDTNQQFIEHIYLNTLNKTYADDPDGIDFWVDRLDDGESRGQVVTDLVLEATQPYNGDAAQNQFNNRVEVSNYAAVWLETAPDDLDALSFDVGLAVTDYPSTVFYAKDAVDMLVPGAGQLYDFTEGTDDIVGTSRRDVASAVFDQANGIVTLNNEDSFDGGDGFDTLEITSDYQNLSLPNISITDVEKLRVVNSVMNWDTIDIAGLDFDEITLDVGGNESGLDVNNVNASTIVVMTNIIESGKTHSIKFNHDDTSSVGNTTVSVSNVTLSSGNENFETFATFRAAETVYTTVSLMNINTQGGEYEHNLDTIGMTGVAVNATFNVENVASINEFNAALYVDQDENSVNNIIVNLTNTDNVDVWMGLDRLGKGTSAEDVVTLNLDGVSSSNGEARFNTSDTETLNVNVLGDSKLKEIGNFKNNDGSLMGDGVVNLNAAANLNVGFWNFNDAGVTANTEFKITGSGNVTIEDLDDGHSNVTVYGSTATGDISLDGLEEGVILVETGSGNDSITVGSNKTSVLTGGGDDFVDTNGKDFSLTGSAVLKGGAGYDTIAIDSAAHFNLTEKNIIQFEALDVSSGKGTYDINFVSSLKDIIASEAIDESIIIENAVPRAALTLNAFESDGKSITMIQENGSRLNDIFKLNLNAIDNNDDRIVDGQTDAIVAAAEYETVRLASNATTASEDSAPGAGDALSPADYTNTVDLFAPDMTVLNISGNAKVAVMLTNASVLAVVDASENTGGIDIDLSGAGTAAGLFVKGSDGADTVTFSGNNNDFIQGNGGADVIRLAGGNDAVRYVKATDSQLMLTDTEMSGFDVINDFTNGGTDHIQLFSQLNLGPNESRFALIQKGNIGGTDPADMKDFIGDGVGFFTDDSDVNRATAFADDGTNGYLFVDGNNDGDFTEAADVMIQLAGVKELSLTDIQFG